MDTFKPELTVFKDSYAALLPKDKKMQLATFAHR